jgi:tetratricopeptide (TPR) repeat protein
MRSSLVPTFVLEQWRAGRSAGRFEAAVLSVDLTGFTALTSHLRRHGVEGAEVLGRILADSLGPIADLVAARGGIVPLYAGDALAAIFPGGADAEARARDVAAHLAALYGDDGLALDTRFGRFVVTARVGLGLGEVEWGIPTDGVRAAFWFRGSAIERAVRAQQQDARAIAGAASPLSGTATLQPTDEELRTFVGEADPSASAEFRPVWPLFLAFEEVEDAGRLSAWIARALTLARELGITFSQVDFGDKGGNLVLFAGAPRTLERGGDRVLGWLDRLRDEAGPRWRAGLAHGVLWCGFRGGAGRLEYGVMGEAINLAARMCMLAPYGEVWVSGPAAEHLAARHELVDRGVHALKGHGSVPILAVVTARARPASARSPVVGRERELGQLEQELRSARASGRARRVLVEGDAGIGKSALVEAFESRRVDAGEAPCLRIVGDALRPSALGPVLHAVGALLGQEPEASPVARRDAFERAMDALVLDLAALEGGAELAEELGRMRSAVGWALGHVDPDAPAARMEPRLRAQNVRRAIVLLLRARAGLGQDVLLVEDAHALDADSLALIDEVAAACADAPLLILGTARPPEVDEPDAVRAFRSRAEGTLRVDPLDAASVEALVRHALAAAPSPSLVGWLSAETGGNPLFVEELALELAASGRLGPDEQGRLRLDAGAPVAVPGGLVELLIARIDRLAGDVRRVVQTAAVLGREFDVRVLSEMLRLDASDPRVGEAERQRVWSVVGRLRYLFRHALVRDAAYTMQLRASLRGLHELAAESLERVHAADLRVHHGEIAHHYREAERPDRELHHVRLAARAAREDHANADALTHYDRALALCPRDDAGWPELLQDRVSLRVQLGQAAAAAADLAVLRERVAGLGRRWDARVALYEVELAQLASRYPEMIEAAGRLQRAARDASDLRLTLEGQHWEAIAVLRTGDYAGAEALLARTLDEVTREGVQHLVTMCSSTLGLVHMERGQFARAAEMHRRILDAEPRRTFARGTAQLNLGLCLMNLRRFEEAREHTQEALACFEEIGQRHAASVALNNLAGLAAKTGDFEAGRRQGERALALKRALGDRRGEAFSHISLAEIDLRSGAPSAALERSRRAAAIFSEIGVPHGRMSANLQIATICEAWLRFDEAAGPLEEALATAAQIGNGGTVRLVRLTLARCAEERGDHEAALAHVAAVLGSSAPTDDPVEARALALASRCHARRGEAALAARRAAEALAAADDAHSRLAALSAAADLAEDSALDGLLDRFSSAWADPVDPVARLLAVHPLAETLIRLSHPAAARWREALDAQRRSMLASFRDDADRDRLRASRWFTAP